MPGIVSYFSMNDNSCIRDGIFFAHFVYLLILILNYVLIATITDSAISKEKTRIDEAKLKTILFSERQNYTRIVEREEREGAER